MHYRTPLNPVMFSLLVFAMQLRLFARTLFMGRREKSRFMVRLLFVQNRPACTRQAAKQI